MYFVHFDFILCLQFFLCFARSNSPNQKFNQDNKIIIFMAQLFYVLFLFSCDSVNLKLFSCHQQQLQSCTYVHMYICMYVCMYVRMCVCTYIYVCTYVKPGLVLYTCTYPLTLTMVCAVTPKASLQSSSCPVTAYLTHTHTHYYNYIAIQVVLHLLI